MSGFLRVLQGEWTKFRTVRSTAICLLAAIGVSVLLELLGASAGTTDANSLPRYTDQAYFVHKSLTGDGSVVARVVSQQNSHEWAKAGLLVKAGIVPGSPYAAVLVTPDHGVRMESMFNTEHAGPAGGTPRWLKLTRSGNSITGYSSTDGRSWQEIGTTNLALPNTVDVGLFVTSPPLYLTTRTGSGNATRISPTLGSATFDDVTVTGTQPAGQDWTGQNITTTPSKETGGLPTGDLQRSGGTFTVTGAGDISGYGIASWRSPGEDDVVMLSLFGVRVGMIAVIALGVLWMTTEYRTGLIRTTFAAGPRRGQVLAAKAVVLGVTVFVAGLVASVASFLLAQPGMHAGGYNPPAYPHVSLLDAKSLRAVVGTALFLALLALFSLGVAVLRRRTVGAIVLVIALVLVPQLVVPVISLDADVWASRLTPLAGLAVQQTSPGQVIGPWAGLGVLCVYVAVALGLARWQLGRRDA